MPDRSRSRGVELECRCGASVTADHWETIDEAARPELVADLLEGRVGRATCPQCSRVVYSKHPVVIVRTGGDRELAVRFSAETAEDPDLDAVSEALGWEPGSRNVTALPFEALPVVLGRDLGFDLAEVELAVAEVEQHHGTRAAEQYQGFMVNILHGDDVRATLEVLELMDPVEDAMQFASVIEKHPSLLERTTIELLHRATEVLPEQAVGLRALAALLQDARDDAAAAWTEYQRFIDRATAELERFAPIVIELRDLVRARRFEEAVARGTEAITEAERAGAPAVAGELDLIVADALLQVQSGDHAENVEAALRHHVRSVERASDDRERGERLAALGIAYGMRVHGDPRSNVEGGLEAMRESERLLSQQGESDLLALIRTNLAQTLERRTSGERRANLDEGYALCRAALRWRSPERNAVDWAYTQVNLGNIVEKRADARGGGVRDARRAYEAVIALADRIADRRIVGLAYSNLGGIHRVKAVKSRFRRRQARHLALAVDALEHALGYFEDVDRLLYGRTMSALADVLEIRDGESGAMAAAREAAAVLRPTLAPDEAEIAATRLGWYLAQRGDWAGAAAAYGDALIAGDLRYHARMLASDRAAELEDRRKVNRWAAFALARDGQSQAAALALENGRMRELRRRLPPDEADLDRLEAVSPDLHRQLMAATADLAHAELADDTDEAARRHQAALERVHALPDFETFAGQVGWRTVAAAAEVGCPLIYVNATPLGTLVLLVTRDTPVGEAAVHATFRDVTSTEIVERLLFGLENGRSAGTSYVAAVMGLRRADLSSALAFNLPWFGTRLASAVDAELRNVGAHGATLVLAGPLALLPLHAAGWHQHGLTVALGEHYAVSVTPSAAAHAAALRAAAGSRGGGRMLAALGDPRDGSDALPAARAEVERIAARFPPESRAVAFGADATSQFLLEHARDATHLHLACHARGVAFDFRETSLQLADGDLPLTRLAGLGRLRARLVVASACQTGVADVTNASEEAYSVGAILLAAGAACTIVSLWTVDDYATALLMVRLYEVLDDTDEPRPAEALRRAQRWMRTLTADEHEAYVGARPELRVELVRRRAARGPRSATNPYGGNRPFADPQYWAGFVPMGA